MEQQYKYFAFISYSSHDQSWGKLLQRKLEHYRMPATLCSEHGWERTPIKPVFFAPTDIQPGGLTAELQERLRASRHLIVICSPHSAQSEWVGKEIEYFHSLGRTENIHFFIVDGIPHSGDPQKECFNPVVHRLGIPEILGANIHERVYRWPWMNRERAYAQLVSKLLGVEFDAIWRRHRRLLRQKALAWLAGAIVVAMVLVFVQKAGQPFDLKVQLLEASAHNDHLPVMKDAVVSITLDNETKTDTVRNLNTPVVFANIPGRCLDEPIRIRVSCDTWMNVDTVLPLKESVNIGIHRNPDTYGKIRVKIWNPIKEKSYPGAEVQVEGHSVTADDSGYVKLIVPLTEQRCVYRITAKKPIINGFLKMPCGPDDIVVVE